MIIIPEEIKMLFKADSINKNLRVCFPNGERGDIINENIIDDSFSFTESICSRDELKFGLCEASVVRFDCVNVENIKGYEIDVYHEIDISSLSEDFISEYGIASADLTFPFYRIPYGRFKVDSCPRQADMKRRSIVAYSDKVYSDSEISPIEKEKQNTVVSTDTPYSFEVGKFIYSNMKNVNVERFSTEGVDGDSEYMFTYTNDTAPYMYQYDINISCRTIHFGGLGSPLQEDYISDLFKVFYDEIEGWEETVEDLYSYALSMGGMELDPVVRTLCSPHISISTSKSKVKRFIINKSYLIYPYISGLKISNDYSCFSVNIPYKVEVKRYMNSGNDYVNTYSLRENCSIQRLVAENWKGFESRIFSLDRVKVASNEYLCQMPDDFNVYSLANAFLEFSGQFGRRNRKGRYEFININNNFALYPSEELYPSETLYPQDPSAGILTRSHYVSAWYEDDYTKPYNRVCVTYMNTDGKLVYAYRQIVDEETDGYNENAYRIYSLSDNYLIKNCTFTEEEIIEILENVAENIKDVWYMPADIDLIGLPWVEAGDVITVITNDAGIETIVLRRTLQGIQTLKDNFESK